MPEKAAKTIYYAHSMTEYGSRKESQDIKFIERSFGPCEVFNPQGKFLPQSWRAWMKRGGLRSFDMVVVRELGGFIGKGVYSEIRRAMNYGVPVKVLRDNKFMDIQDVKIVNRADWQFRYARIEV